LPPRWLVNFAGPILQISLSVRGRVRDTRRVIFDAEPAPLSVEFERVALAGHLPVMAATPAEWG